MFGLPACRQLMKNAFGPTPHCRVAHRAFRIEQEKQVWLNKTKSADVISHRDRFQLCRLIMNWITLSLLGPQPPPSHISWQELLQFLFYFTIYFLKFSHFILILFYHFIFLVLFYFLSFFFLFSYYLFSSWITFRVQQNSLLKRHFFLNSVNDVGE